MSIHKKKLFLIVFLAGFFHILEAADYCSIARKQCGGEDHAMCVNGKPIDYYDDEQLTDYRGYTATRRARNNNRYLSKDEKKEILNFHNALRQKVAMGHETRVKHGPLPPSTNLPNLEWDDELEKLAQTSVNDFQFHILTTRRCAHTKFDRVGENRASSSIPETPYQFYGNLRGLLEKWENEVKSFDANDVEKYKSNPAASFYTQMIWGATTKIGCGYQVWYNSSLLPGRGGVKGNNGGHEYRLICYYATQGNVENQPVYEKFDHGKIIFHTKFANE